MKDGEGWTITTRRIWWTWLAGILMLGAAGTYERSHGGVSYGFNTFLGLLIIGLTILAAIWAHRVKQRM